MELPPFSMLYCLQKRLLEGKADKLSSCKLMYIIIFHRGSTEVESELKYHLTTPE